MKVLRQPYHIKQESTENGYDDWTRLISVGLDSFTRITTKVETVFLSKSTWNYFVEPYYRNFTVVNEKKQKNEK